jgi:hypothetical protein
MVNEKMGLPFYSRKKLYSVIVSDSAAVVEHDHAVNEPDDGIRCDTIDCFVPRNDADFSILVIRKIRIYSS